MAQVERDRVDAQAKELNRKWGSVTGVGPITRSNYGGGVNRAQPYPTSKNGGGSK
jgi:hypothetical protein